jgi:hypothetical protein
MDGFQMLVSESGENLAKDIIDHLILAPAWTQAGPRRGRRTTHGI